MAIVKDFRKLCPPALFYFIISIIALFISVLQNINNKNKYTLGSFSCNVPSTFLIFVIKLLYIIFWTWILNLICKNNYTWLSWVLVFFPFVLLVIIFLLLNIKYAITKI